MHVQCIFDTPGTPFDHPHPFRTPTTSCDTSGRIFGTTRHVFDTPDAFLAPWHPFQPPNTPEKSKWCPNNAFMHRSGFFSFFFASLLILFRAPPHVFSPPSRIFGPHYAFLTAWCLFPTPTMRF